LIYEEEKDSEEKDFWVFFVGPRAPFLALSGGGFSGVLFIGAQHRFRERRAHHRLRILSFGGSVLHCSARDFAGGFPLTRSTVPCILRASGGL
jgi:hypothetical protein